MIFAHTNPDKILPQAGVEFRVYMDTWEIEQLSPKECTDKICSKLMDEILPKLKNVLEKRKSQPPRTPADE